MIKIKQYLLIFFFSLLANTGFAEEPASAPAPATTQETIESPTSAEPAIRYRVTYTGADEWTDLFKQYLEIEQLKKDPQMSELQLDRLYDEAPEQIRGLLATEGYFAAVVQPRIRRSPAETVIQFNITLGEPTRITGVEITFLGEITQQDASSPTNPDTLKQNWQLPIGSIFKQADWEKAKTHLLAETSQKRYAQAAIIDSEALIDRPNNHATLKITIDSGAHYRMGAPIVEGLSKYPDEIIAENNAIQEGEDYDQKKLLALQERLQQTGFFKTVEVTPNFDESSAGKTPLLIAVTEKPSKLFNIGVGYSNNTGARGQIGYQDYNIFRKGWTWRSLLKLETQNQSLESQILLRPRSNFRDSIGLKLTRDQEDEAQDVLTTEFNIIRNWGDEKFNRLLRLRSSYKQTTYKFDGLAEDYSYNSYLTALGYSWIKRQLNNPLYPDNGYTMHLHLDGAIRNVLSNISFARVHSKLEWYKPLSPKIHFKWRGELGAHWVGDSKADNTLDEKNILDDYLFKLGGDQTIRGYTNKSIGLYSGDLDILVGGNYMGLMSSELTYWFLDKWGVAAFVDVGGVTDNISDFTAYTGYGIGGRWHSPVGPFNFDVAYGQAVKKWHWHLSLGVAY